jgi:uncharacterized protein YndB with AHSA1/START domain
MSKAALSEQSRERPAHPMDPVKFEPSPAMLDPATSVRAIVRVEVSIEHAFRVFTADFGRWWPATHHLGASPLVTAVIEPRVGGRWYELDVDGSTCDWGIVLVWDPPRHVAVSWNIDGDFRLEQPGQRSSRIDVRFAADPDGSTQVELLHSGLDVHGDGWRRLRERVGAGDGWSGILCRYADWLNLPADAR